MIRAWRLSRKFLSLSRGHCSAPLLELPMGLPQELLGSRPRGPPSSTRLPLVIGRRLCSRSSRGGQELLGAREDAGGHGQRRARGVLEEADAHALAEPLLVLLQKLRRVRVVQLAAVHPFVNGLQLELLQGSTEHQRRRVGRSLRVAPLQQLLGDAAVARALREDLLLGALAQRRLRDLEEQRVERVSSRLLRFHSQALHNIT